MAQHGGKRTPRNPAPVSGPGALSRRTDGGPTDTQAMEQLPNAKYGEQAAFQDIQGGAAMAGNPVPTPAPTPTPTAVPMGADTQRPNEPVTAGSPFGPGVGPVAAGIDTRNPDQQDASALQAMLPVWEYLANQPDSSPSTRALVRRLKANS